LKKVFPIDGIDFKTRSQPVGDNNTIFWEDEIARTASSSYIGFIINS
jgi:hypothetical protein